MLLYFKYYLYFTPLEGREAKSWGIYSLNYTSLLLYFNYSTCYTVSNTPGGQRGKRLGDILTEFPPLKLALGKHNILFTSFDRGGGDGYWLCIIHDVCLQNCVYTLKFIFPMLLLQMCERGTFRTIKYFLYRRHVLCTFQIPVNF